MGECRDHSRSDTGILGNLSTATHLLSFYLRSLFVACIYGRIGLLSAWLRSFFLFLCWLNLNQTNGNTEEIISLLFMERGEIAVDNESKMVLLNNAGIRMGYPYPSIEQSVHVPLSIRKANSVI
jgi:hypothetical protein